VSLSLQHSSAVQILFKHDVVNDVSTCVPVPPTPPPPHQIVDVSVVHASLSSQHSLVVHTCDAQENVELPTLLLRCVRPTVMVLREDMK
jgi:hypothetical protein